MVLVCVILFIILPLELIVLIDVKKTKAEAQQALADTKKLRNELKPKKEEKDD
jgi:hypothetical protein